jgi:hypothetical protein
MVPFPAGRQRFQLTIVARQLASQGQRRFGLLGGQMGNHQRHQLHPQLAGSRRCDLVAPAVAPASGAGPCFMSGTMAAMLASSTAPAPAIHPVRVGTAKA